MIMISVYFLPAPAIDHQLFSEHPYYLPHMVFTVDLSSPPLEPYLEIVKTSVQANLNAPNNESAKTKVPAGSKTKRVAKALEMDTKHEKEPVN